MHDTETDLEKPLVDLLEAPTTRRCPKCDTDLPLESFRLRPDRPGKRQSWCIPCTQVSSRQWRDRNPSRIRGYNLRAKGYGISVEDADRMLVEQAGLCPICQAPPTKPVVDHDHQTGEVRGILCNNCNGLLGFAADDIDRLVNAINYLRAH